MRPTAWRRARREAGAIYGQRIRKSERPAEAFLEFFSPSELPAWREMKQPMEDLQTREAGDRSASERAKSLDLGRSA